MYCLCVFNVLHNFIANSASYDDEDGSSSYEAELAIYIHTYKGIVRLETSEDLEKFCRVQRRTSGQLATYCIDMYRTIFPERAAALLTT